VDLDILVPIAGMATGLLLLLPIVRSVVRITERKLTGAGESEQLAELRDELRIVQDRLERIEFGDDRVAELEERVDFAERLLAQHREAPRVDGGS
jgi:hypothetical protein